MKQHRTLLLAGTIFAAGLTLSGQAPPKPAADPKCAFLRQELTRLQNFPAPIPDRIPASIRPLYGRHAAEVNANIVQGKIESCGKKEKLSSLGRLRTLDSVRLEHIAKIRQEFQGATADALVEAVNNLYEEEATSFYNYERVKVMANDRDVVKDFPMLVDLVQGSGLAAEIKASFVKDFRYINYEEAGRLQNGLRGLDKDLGTTFLYVLRNDLSERAATDAAQREEQRKASEEAQTKAVYDAKLNARITLSISAIVVLALVGFILIRRELVTLQAWLNVGAVAAVVLVGWILVTMGLLTWLQGYVGLAF